jgi:hypothetical protein
MPSVIESGRYVCLRTPGFPARVIRLVTRSKYNHAVITGPDGAIIEATPEGVRLGTLSEYAGMPACANTAEPMTDAERDAVWAKAQTLLGDGYNWAADAAIGLADLGWHWRLLMHIAGADKLLMCSQTVVFSGEGPEPPMPWMCGKTSPAQVAPADLARRPGVEPVSI